MTQKSIHIGLAIEQKLQEKKMSKTDFGRLIGVPQQNVNRILDKGTIDTGKLVKISEALQFNFFSLYCEDSKVIHTEGPNSPATDSGRIYMTVGDAVLAERAKSLEAIIKEKDSRIEELKERISELKEKGK